MVSNIIDLSSDTANMFGIEPCPKCSSEYRYIMAKEPNIIRCDCGHREEVDNDINN